MKADYDPPADYQRNDDIGWTTETKTKDTRTKRIRRMIDEPECGGASMGIDHALSAKR